MRCLSLQVITVGTQTFEFTTRDEDRTCDLVQLPSAGSGAALEVGRVTQTLFIKVLNLCTSPVVPRLHGASE